MKNPTRIFKTGILLAFFCGFGFVSAQAQTIVKKIAQRSCRCFEEQSKNLRQPQEVVNAFTSCIAQYTPPFSPELIELKDDFFLFRDSVDFEIKIREEVDALCGEKVNVRLRNKD